uniref:Uncharacterized protein n=1 Tax=Arundo donax TaxID=35708 RepID=A0A0A9FYH9_ARUDO
MMIRIPSIQIQSALRSSFCSPLLICLLIQPDCLLLELFRTAEKLPFYWFLNV